MNERKRLRLARQQIAGAAGVGRFIGGLFGFVFLGIGLTVLGNLWLTSFGGFGSPPLIFRLFGSFIAIAFVGIGGAMAFGAIMGKQLVQQHLDAVEAEDGQIDDTDGARSGERRHYACRHCGAPLDDEADVSPHGDVKCTYCNTWFNIHGS